jgi:hypothetical protein
MLVLFPSIEKLKHVVLFVAWTWCLGGPASPASAFVLYEHHELLLYIIKNLPQPGMTTGWVWGRFDKNSFVATPVGEKLHPASAPTWFRAGFGSPAGLRKVEVNLIMRP